MNKRGETQAAPGSGSERSPVVIVGQSNGVHCHPPKNHTSLPLWIKNCHSYLKSGA